MDTTIRDDFADFINNNDLFNSDVLLYDAQGGTLVFEGRGTFDKKPQLIQNESGQFDYQGHQSIVALSMSLLTFMSNYFDLKGYYIEITDNSETISYNIINSHYNSNSNAILCDLKKV
ncbi:MAG: hypothetical protein QNK20_14430 [Aureibaculum sp.]|nr:hypothetical protein [Aureibaculum sp.]